MDDTPPVETEVYPTHDALSRAAAERIEAAVTDTLASQDLCAVALAGGSTPRQTYELLSSADWAWDRIHWFWGDERMVPHGHPESNVHLARTTLFDGVAVPDDHVHPMPTAGPPDQAAARYEGTLRRHLGDRDYTFDLVLLGLGADGHTASLFPDTDLHPDDSAWVRPTTAPTDHAIRQRLTCTLAALNQARAGYFLVSGESKRNAVRAVLDDQDPSLPATHVRPTRQLRWFLDEAARPHAA